MSRDFPDWVNPWTAAEGRRLFEGTLPLAWMERLAPLLAPDSDAGGEAAFEAAFSLDGERRPVIRLKVTAQLPLVCQASLVVYEEAVDRSVLLGVAAGELEADAMPDHYEAVVAQEGRLALARLVEDELLLGVPQIPRRPDLSPVGYHAGDGEPTDQEETRKPFADLQKMLAVDKAARTTDKQ